MTKEHGKRAESLLDNSVYFCGTNILKSDWNYNLQYYARPIMNSEGNDKFL